MALNSKSDKGYCQGALDGRPLKAHTIIWKLVYNEEPECILHSKGNTCDNRLESLSSGTKSDNSKDQKLYKRNSGGFTGVSWHSRDRKWIAYIRLDGKLKHLGSFINKEDAITKRKEANIQFNFHPDHGLR